MAKTALITGASSGIGYELTQLFATDGYNLVLVSRNAQKLLQLGAELKGKFEIEVKVIPKDLSLPRSSSEIFIELQQLAIHVDVLVNNAGFGAYGLFAEIDLATELDMIQLNLTSLTQLTQYFLKEMLKRGEGKILNVASTAAFQPGPLMAVYYATKAYVLSFSEALYEELRGTGITVTCLCPGATQSDFQRRAHIEKIKFLKFKIPDAKTVARTGYLGLMQEKRLVIPGFKNKLFAWGVRLIPRGLAIRIVKSLQELREDLTL